jgi:hypothetical protein
MTALNDEPSNCVPRDEPLYVLLEHIVIMSCGIFLEFGSQRVRWSCDMGNRGSFVKWWVRAVVVTDVHR